MIEVSHVSIRSGKFLLQDITFEIPSGEYAVLMGRTGHGKTTILEAICGLRSIESGRICIDRRDVSRADPAERNFGYVPQDLALFPTLSVREQLAFALRLRRANRAAISSRVAELAELLGIQHLLDRRIQGLSGGEAQRVALGRALSFRPPVLLLDEPLSALDESTRTEIHQLLKSIQKQTGVTTLHVTHSQEEATALANRVLILKDGRVSNATFGLSDLTALDSEAAQ